MTARPRVKNARCSTDRRRPKRSSLLAKPHAGAHHRRKDDFADCVGSKMAKSTGIQVRPERSFDRSDVPWLEPSTAPQRPRASRSSCRETSHRGPRRREAACAISSGLTARRRQTDAAAAASPARSVLPAAAASVSGGGRRNPTTRPIVWDLEYRQDRGLGIDQRHRHFGPGRRARAAAASSRACRVRPVTGWQASWAPS